MGLFWGGRRAIKTPKSHISFEDSISNNKNKSNLVKKIYKSKKKQRLLNKKLLKQSNYKENFFNYAALG